MPWSPASTRLDRLTNGSQAVTPTGATGYIVPQGTTVFTQFQVGFS